MSQSRPKRRREPSPAALLQQRESNDTTAAAAGGLAASASSPSPSGLMSLPLDTLTRIASFVPVIGRVRVVSVLCKRWRSAAYRSITSLRVASNPFNIKSDVPYFDVAKARPLLPCLRTLELFEPLPVESIRTWTSLTDVALSPGYYAQQPAADGYYLPPSITALHLYGNDPLHPLLLQQHSSALRSLELCRGKGAPDTAPPPVLPQLTALSLRFDSAFASALAAQHASQLVSLTVGGEAACKPLLAVGATFPVLRRLEAHELSEESLRTLLARMPALTSLHLYDCNDDDVCSERVRPLLIEYDTNQPVTQELRAFLDGCPRLQRASCWASVDADDEEGDALRALSHYEPVVTLTHISRATLHALGALTHLSCLTIDEHDNAALAAVLPLLDGSVQLPSLRELTINVNNDYRTSRIQRVLQLVPPLVRSAPALQSLALIPLERTTSPLNASAHGLVQLARLLLTLDRRGLRLLDFYCIQLKALAWLLRRHGLLHWLVVQGEQLDLNQLPLSDSQHSLAELQQSARLTDAAIVAHARAGECDFEGERWFARHEDEEGESESSAEKDGESESSADE